MSTPVRWSSCAARQQPGPAGSQSSSTASTRSCSEKLSKLQGAEFDRAYMDAMVDAHKDAEKLLKSRAGKNGSASASNMGQNQGTSAAEGTSSPSGSRSRPSAMGTSRPLAAAPPRPPARAVDERQHRDGHAKRGHAWHDRDDGNVR